MTGPERGLSAKRIWTASSKPCSPTERWGLRMRPTESTVSPGRMCRQRPLTFRSVRYERLTCLSARFRSGDQAESANLLVAHSCCDGRAYPVNLDLPIRNDRQEFTDSSPSSIPVGRQALI